MGVEKNIRGKNVEKISSGKNTQWKKLKFKNLGKFI